jgi:guanylate kinase
LSSSNGSLFVISAPSGSGKTSLAKGALARVQGLSFSVSYTTRPLRGQEQQGKDYHFVTVEQFQAMIERQHFLEWESVYGRHYYGTALPPVEEAFSRGEDVLLDIDVKGARKVKERCPEAVLIFVMPPSYAELENRLRQRGVDREEEILNRLTIAREEIKDYKMYDFIIVNSEIDASVARLREIILATRSRTARMEAVVAPIVRTFQP